MDDDLEITVENGVAARPIFPRMGDEIVLPDGKRLLVLSVLKAKSILMEAGNKAMTVEATMRAMMGEYWRERYWKVLVKHMTGGSPFWMDVMDVERHGGKIESHHLEIE